MNLPRRSVGTWVGLAAVLVVAAACEPASPAAPASGPPLAAVRQAAADSTGGAQAAHDGALWRAARPERHRAGERTVRISHGASLTRASPRTTRTCQPGACRSRALRSEWPLESKRGRHDADRISPEAGPPLA